jgi:hypothetical protein
MAHVFQCENIKETPFLYNLQNEIRGQNIWVKFSSCNLVTN